MSTFELHIGDARFHIATEDATSIAIPIHFDGPQPNAFGLPRATAEPFRSGDFIADVREGAPVNCFTVTINPHGSGTHTECIGHILSDRVSVGTTMRSPLVSARLVTVEPVRLGDTVDTYEGPQSPDDWVIPAQALAEALAAEPRAEALVIRRRSRASLAHASYTDANPPYFTVEAMRAVRANDIQHFLTDLPSVDRENDDGLLTCHHIFWDVPLHAHAHPGEIPAWTITEMIDVPSHLPDGLYALSLGVPAFLLDAAPSNPVLFPLRPLP